MLLYMYITLGQGQTTLCGQNLDVNRKALSLFADLLQVSKKYLWRLILYVIFHVLIHVYGPGIGADNPLGSKYLYKHKPFVTLVICCKLLPLNDFLTVFPYKSMRDQFDFAIKQVKVNLGSSFEQTMMGPRPQCYMPSQKVIGPLVLEKIFEGFLSYMGMTAILVIWPRPSKQTFVPTSHCSRLHMKFGFDWPSSFGEDLWKWWMDMDDGWQSMAILKAHQWA